MITTDRTPRDRLSSLSPLILRLATAGIFIHHGLGGFMPVGSSEAPSLAAIEGGVSWPQLFAIGEMGVGLLLALGLCTRLIALPLIAAGGVSAAAACCATGACPLTTLVSDVVPGPYGGALLAAVGLSLLASGGGRVALDAIAFRRKTEHDAES